MRRYVAWPLPDDLTQLVSHAQRDGPGALDTLLATLRPALLAFFTYRFPSDSAEDLTQIVLIRIAKALPRIDPERAHRYLPAIARNLLRTAYRRRARDRDRYLLFGLTEVPEPRISIDLQVEYEDLVRAVHAASAATLPPSLGEIVVRILRGDTPAEIAAGQGGESGHDPDPSFAGTSAASSRAPGTPQGAEPARAPKRVAAPELGRLRRTPRPIRRYLAV